MQETRKFLSEHLKNTNKSWTSCWRGDVDGWNARVFHRKCDNKGIMLTLIQVNTFVFGAYVDKPCTGKPVLFNIKYYVMFDLRTKTCSPCLHSLVKTEANVWKNSRADQWKPETQSKVSPAREFLQTLPRFSTGYGGTDMFYFFYKIIILIINEEKDGLQSSYCKFSQLWDRQTT